MDQQTGIQLMLILAAVFSIAAAGFALTLVPLTRMRAWWLVLCAALGIQALRRVVAVANHATLFEAISGLAASALFLIGLMGLRHVFLTLRETEERLDEEVSRDAVIENRADAAIVMLDLDGCVTDLNPAARALVHANGQDLVGRNWFDTFVDENLREAARTSFRKLVESPDRNDEFVQYMLTDFDGREHSVVWHRRILRNAHGDAIGVRGAGVDLSEGSLLENELAFRSLLLDHTNDSILVYRFDGTVVYANDVACTYRGVRREELIGADVRNFIPLRDRDAFSIHLETVERGSCITFITEAESRDGIVRPLECHICPVSLGGDTLVVDVARDITERREAEAAMRRMAYTDHLTGLPNRVLLVDRSALAIARATRQKERLALLFMDLDNLKTVNDTMGHAAGDELLRQVGERLAGEFRGEDTVARIGGDEFVILVRVADEPAAEVVAGRLVELLADPFVVGGEEAFASASVGVALFPEDGGDLDELVAKADAAMYAAKDAGRARYRLASWKSGEHEASAATREARRLT